MVLTINMIFLTFTFKICKYSYRSVENLNIDISISANIIL